MHKITSFLIFIASIFTLPLIAQLTPEEAVAGMGRGINLGNTLEPPYEGSWNNGLAKESHFDVYVEAGFTNVRIPVRWDNHTGTSAPFDVNETWMDRVEEVVDWGLSRGFYITLNGHHEDWLKNGYSNAILRDRYDAIWTQIAERFQDKSDKLLFEIINEPNGMSVSQVDDLNERILGIIRQNNPTRIVIYGGNMYNNTANLFSAAIPDDDYTIAYYHAYDPWQFSGQGLGTWGTANDYQQLRNKYQSVKAWSDVRDMPVHHSEFGAVHACDYNSRMRIYAHNVEQCVVNGFAFSVWDDGGNFGILQRSDDTWPEIKDILVHYYEDSPNEIFSRLEIGANVEESTIVVDWNNRATDNGNIILERAESTANDFVQIAELPADATTYTDQDIDINTTYTYRMYTTRSDGTLLHGYPTRIRVNGIVQTSFNSSPINIPGTLEVEEYDNGGEGLAYHDFEANNIPGAFRPDEGVDIGAHDGGFILEYVENNEWIEYTVDVQTAGTYRIDAMVASQVSNGRFSITSDKNNATADFLSPGTGSWTNFQQISADNEIELEAGVQILKLDINNGNPFNIDRLMFVLNIVDVEDQEIKNLGFVISPNPTSGIVNIELSNRLESKDLKVELLRITGGKVRSYDVSETEFSINLSDYESGVYVLRLVGQDVTESKRIIISR